MPKKVLVIGSSLREKAIPKHWQTHLPPGHKALGTM